MLQVAESVAHLEDVRLVGVLKTVTRAARWESRSSPKPVSGQGKVVSGRGVACVAYEKQRLLRAGRRGRVDLETGEVYPKRFHVALDCGPVPNPDGLRNQTEGGILQGMSRALVEEVTWDDRRVTSTDWESYKSLSLGYAMPSIEILFATTESVPAIGAGETAITVTPAAIGNAIFDATGARLRDLPFSRNASRRHLIGSRREGSGE